MFRMRPATIEDVPILSYWDTLPHVVAATGDDDVIDWEWELTRETDWKWDLVAEVDEEPIGIVQIIDPAREETHYWGDIESNLRAIDIWIGPAEFLGQGYGTLMMQEALKQCFSDPAVTAVLIDPLEHNKRARNFYERIGFRYLEDRIFGQDHCAVYRLDRCTFLRQPSHSD